MDLKMINAQGQLGAPISVQEAVFGRDFNEALVHQVVVAYQANARAGNRKQKDREEVHHSTKNAIQAKGHWSCPCRDDLVATMAWRWQNFSKYARRKFHAEDKSENVPGWFGGNSVPVGEGGSFGCCG